MIERPKIIIPAKPHVCGRCGGFDRRWLREHRRHAGIGWLHGACNCCAICTSLGIRHVLVVLDGFNANLCGVCFNSGSPPSSTIGYSNYSVDGEYVVPFWQEGFGGCRFRKVFTGSFLDRNFWEVAPDPDNPSCVGTPDEVDEFTQMEIFLDISSTQLHMIELQIVRQSVNQTVHVADEFLVNSPTYPYVHNHTFTCNDFDPIASSGTVTVTPVLEE